MSDTNVTLSDEEMVAWANASIDRVRELEAENERLRERLEIAGAHPFPKDFDALDLAVERNKALEAEIERLTAELKATQENEQRLVDANKPLLADNHRLQARVEELEGVVSKWQEVGRSTLDQLEHEGDSVIFIPKSHEDTMRRLLAATEDV